MWVYVYRDFSRKGQDKDAERTSWRFGVTSWPQLFLADPLSLKILAHTGRKPESFLAAVERTKVEKTRSQAELEKTRAAEERADKLEKGGSKKLAKKGIDDEDIVVRYLSLRILAKKAPKVVVARARELLAVPNDPFRYEVCAVLGKHAGGDAKEALEAVVAEPKESLNPNVLRICAVRALTTCGDARSVDAIAPFAGSGAYFNGLTGVSIDALAEIAKRDPNARAAVRKALKASYPEPAPVSDQRATRACIALAKRVHKALGSRRRFPDPYDKKARERLMRD
ncbi:MAG: HEAT repeat domain-containing protein [Planctomycetota bacterium]